MQAGYSRRRLIAVLVVAGAVLAAWQLDLIGRVSYAIEKGRLEATSEELAGVEQLSRVFRMVARKVRPAVVLIRTSGKAAEEPEQEQGEQEDRSERRRQRELERLPEFWRRFFEDFGPFRFRFEGPRIRPRRRFIAMGSGVIVDAEKGYILTNYHVIEQAGKIRVQLADGRSFVADEIVGTDKLSDLAVIRIKADRLHELEFGDSDAVEVGDYVLAVGNPFGLEGSVSAGIVSAKGRSGMRLPGYQDFIQTDAAINPGNSGGPLVNMRGQIIGINRAIPTVTGAYNGFGFAIPGYRAKRVMERLIREGKVVRGYLGVAIRDLEPGEGRRVFGLEEDRGVLVQGVGEDTPAARAGIKEGDVILQMGDQPVENSTALQNRVEFTRPGTKVRFKILREGKRRTVEVEVGEQPEGFSPFGRLPSWAGRARPERAEQVSNEKLGMTVATLTRELAKRYDWGEDEVGAVITKVKPGSEAESLALRPGDLVVAVVIEQKRHAIGSAKDFGKLVTAETLRGGLTMVVKTRDGLTRWLYLRYE
ncbi:MAG: Do family serine endopeptidase [Phycisphaerae bacterium]